MEKRSAFARVMAQARINELVNQPVLGQPYLKFGQCRPLWGYFFQLGGILGAIHRDNLDAFGEAFLGLTGKVGTIERFFTNVANETRR
jgi:hypothetical protein